MSVYFFKDRVVAPKVNPWGTILYDQYFLSRNDWVLGGVTSVYHRRYYSDKFRFGQSPTDKSETNLSLSLDLTSVVTLKIEWEWIVSLNTGWGDANFRISGIRGIRYYRTSWSKTIDSLDASDVTGLQTIQLASRNGIQYYIWRIWGENNNGKLVFFCGVA